MELRNDHLRKEGLQKAKKAMLNALTKEKDDKNWGSDSSGLGKDYPGSGATVQLWDEHARFLRGLPAYLCYGGRRSNDYHCPCSRTMKKWQKGINLNLPKKRRCSGNFTGLVTLLDHCKSKKDVYHSGFKEYVRTIKGRAQQTNPAAGRGADSVTKRANANPGQPSPHASRLSDARV